MTDTCSTMVLKGFSLVYNTEMYYFQAFGHVGLVMMQWMTTLELTSGQKRKVRPTFQWVDGSTLTTLTLRIARQSGNLTL